MIDLMLYKKGYSEYNKYFTGKVEGYGSQNGEDGVLEKIIDELGIVAGSCLEVGAGNGVDYSSAHRLSKFNWKLLMIEGNNSAYADLVSTYRGNKNVICYHGNISAKLEERKIDTIVDETKFTKDLDILILDVDGVDYYIWESLKLQPKVVVVEYNSTFLNYETIKYMEDFAWDGTRYYGASPKLLNQLASKKGYELVAICWPCNLIFLRKDCNCGKFNVYDIEDNNIKHLWHLADHHICDDSCRTLVDLKDT